MAAVEMMEIWAGGIRAEDVRKLGDEQHIVALEGLYIKRLSARTFKVKAISPLIRDLANDEAVTIVRLGEGTAIAIENFGTCQGLVNESTGPTAGILGTAQEVRIAKLTSVQGNRSSSSETTETVAAAAVQGKQKLPSAEKEHGNISRGRDAPSLQIRVYN